MQDFRGVGDILDPNGRTNDARKQSDFTVGECIEDAWKWNRIQETTSISCDRDEHNPHNYDCFMWENNAFQQEERQVYGAS